MVALSDINVMEVASMAQRSPVFLSTQKNRVPYFSMRLQNLIMNRWLPVWDNMPEHFGIIWLSLLPLPCGTLRSRQAESLGVTPSPLNLSMGISWLGIPKIWGRFKLDLGARVGEELCWGGAPCSQLSSAVMPPYKEASRLLCTVMDTFADFVPLLGLALPNCVAFASLPAQLMFLLEEYLNYLLEPLCPVGQIFLWVIIHKNYLSTQSGTSRLVLLLCTFTELGSFSIHMLQILNKGRSDTPADFDLFC